MLNNDNLETKKWIAQLVDPSLGAARMPSPVPIESCLYSEKTIITIPIASEGDFAYTLFPASTGGLRMFASARASGAPVYGSNTPTTRLALGLTGHSYNDSTDFAGPLNYTESYRITGASVKVTYIGRADAASGLVRTCTGISKTPTSETEATASQIVDGMTSKVVRTPQISYNTWYPHDISAFEFKQGSEHSSTESTILYGMGYGFAQGTSVELEVCVNFEYVPLLVHQELLGANARYGPTVSNGILGSVTKQLKSDLSGLYNNNKSSVISSVLSSLGGFLSPSIGLPSKALMLM